MLTRPDPFDVAPDGRFVAILQDPEAALNRLRVVFIWFEELIRPVPPGSEHPC